MKRSRRNLLTLIFLASIMLTACDILGAGQSNPLEGSSWQLTSYRKSGLIPDTLMTANFNGGEIRGTGGCNSYFGSYSINGTSLTINELGWTEMACLDPAGVMEQEQVFMSLLSTADTFSYAGEILQIITDSGEYLIFERVK